MLLNQETVLDRLSNPHVFLLDAGVAGLQPVVLREFDTASVEIVSGLDEDDYVLMGPDLIRLVDGDPVPDNIDADR